MSDTEQEWKPNPRRPQSTMAQAFSATLDSVFMLDSEVDHLAQTIEQKKMMMTIRARELEALQARIREAEERLKERESRVASPTGSNGRISPNENTEEAGRPNGEAAEEKPQARSLMSSPVSDGHPSEEGAESPTSAATSHDLHEAGSEDDDEGKEKARES